MASSEGNERSTVGSTAITPGQIAGIVVGSIVGFILIVTLALVGKRKLTANPDTDLLHEDEMQNAKMPEFEGGESAKQEMDGRRYLGAELDASKDIQEMKSNEEVGQELQSLNIHVSELPS